jgi:hypothetical protein
MVLRLKAMLKEPDTLKPKSFHLRPSDLTRLVQLVAALAPVLAELMQSRTVLPLWEALPLVFWAVVAAHLSAVLKLFLLPS